MTVFILGGGAAGLAAADGLIDSGVHDFVVLERGARLGGLAQTLSWGNAGSHDLGPHKLFTLDRDLMQRVEALLPASDWLTRDKISKIYLKGHYLPYPPSPLSLIGVFGLATFIRMTAGYAAARVSSLGANEPTTFEEDLSGRVGSGLYGALFKPIAMKLWGDPARLDVKLSRGRVQTPSIFEIIARLLKLKSGSDFEALTFRYPSGGLSRLWDAIETKVGAKGTIHLRHTVVGLRVADNAIREIRAREETTGREIAIPVASTDLVASTLPLGQTVDFLSDSIPAELAALARKIIILNDLLLVFLHVDRPSLLPESWVFVPDSDIIFHRLSEQESFDPAMTQSGSIVCCEIMSHEARPMSARSDAELIDATLKGLSDMGYNGFSVNASKVIRLPRSYPVYRPGYAQGLERIMDALDRTKNFRTLGRQGSFNYIGTLDAMDIGYGFARWYRDRAQVPWEQERSRTSHYPVLD